MTRERQDNVSLSGAKGFIMMTSGAVFGHGQIWVDLIVDVRARSG